MNLNPYRFFDPDEKVRDIAFELYQEVKDLPIISPHGHVDPKILADNEPFPDPAEMFIIPDHYVYRMLYSMGIRLESLGISTRDGSPAETDYRKIWQTFANHFYLFSGTPTGIWLTHEFSEVFGIHTKLNSENAQEIYDEIQKKLNLPEFLPQALFNSFKIEVLATTDGAADKLSNHQKIRESNWNGRVVPSFRPDSVIDLSRWNWREEIGALESTTGMEINSFKSFLKALEERREFFKSMGATSTDQGVFSPYTRELSPVEVETIFQRALKGKVTAENAASFNAHMLMEMARMSMEDGLVMQIHPGSYRNHNQKIFEKFGLDKGCDIPVQTEYTRNLHELLNKYGNDPGFSLIIFTLDESTYSRELAPLAGHYPTMKLGPPWWFHDSIQGMMRYKEMVYETASIYNTVGFIDDTRAFPSIPARHDLSRRLDANFMAGQVARNIIDKEDAHKMMKALAYDLGKKAYKL